MTKADLSDIYRDYIACLNRQDWPKLGQFVDDRVNSTTAGRSACRVIARCWSGILMKSRTSTSTSQLLIADAPYVASRLAFDCSPKGAFLGLDVNGKRVSFAGERVLRVPGAKDRAGMVCHRQGGDRSPALSALGVTPGSSGAAAGLFRARCFASPRNDDGESYRKLATPIPSTASMSVVVARCADTDGWLCHCLNFSENDRRAS